MSNKSNTPNKDRTTTSSGKSGSTAAEKRLSNALVYLHANGVDIESRTDIHYRQALKIAAGVPLTNELESV